MFLIGSGIKDYLDNNNLISKNYKLENISSISYVLTIDKFIIEIKK